MTTITLPSDIEQPLTEQARKQGTTPEELVIATLRREFVLTAPKNEAVAGKSLYDVLADHIGAVSGTGEAYSENCGERFAAGMLEKRRRGRL